MKKIIKIATLLVASLLLFASCEQADSPIEKTWKMTFTASPMYSAPIKADEVSTKGIEFMMPGHNDIYFSISGRSVILSMNIPSFYTTFAPQFKGHLVITGAGTFTQIETTSTSGKIIFTGLDLPWDNYNGETIFEYRDLTSTSMTLVLPIGALKSKVMLEEEEGEIVYTLTAVKNRPPLITLEELEMAIPIM